MKIYLIKILKDKSIYLSRQFKKEVGITVTQFINHSKVLEAKKLLEKKSHSVLDISVMLGFSNSSHFTKVFKQELKITPKQYQKKHMTNLKNQ